MSKINNYVVYAYSRKDGTFYYIGKGRPQRPYSNRRHVKMPSDRSRIHILHKNLDEDTAYLYEEKLINFYGRKDLFPEWGILRNMADGGRGGPGASAKYTADWYHLEHGYVRNKSVKELSDMFPELNMCLSSLNKVRNGQKKHFKLWTLASTPENSKYVCLKGAKYKWFHEKHGTHYLAQIELARKFNISEKHLSNVASGKLNHYKGWTLLERKEILRYKNLNGSKFKWIHEEHGEVICSQTELIKKYPEMELASSALSGVCTCSRNQHKGWKVEKCSKPFQSD